METIVNKEFRKVLEKFKDKYFIENNVNKSKLIQDIDTYNEELIKEFLENEIIKENFTINISGNIIIQTNKIIQLFEADEYWQDSYTRYSKKIGLTAGGKFIDESTDVVLDFPYKDTVLKASMSKEDTDKDDLRPNEPFLNEVVAKEEIDVLLDKKILVNAKKYDEYAVREVDRYVENDNLIIKGNNLLALHTLKEKFSGKVKSIFIDPPYNTGNDAFRYNDRFNQSTWLTFMKNRLEIARDLLSSDGSISMTIDYNELGHLLILCNDIFGQENLQNIITIKRASASGAKVINPGVVNITDYLVIFSKERSKWKPNKVFAPKDRDTRYNQFLLNKEEPYEEWNYIPLLDAFSREKEIKKSQLRKELGDSFQKEFDQFAYKNAEKVFRFVSLDDSQISAEAKRVKYKSKEDPSKILFMPREGYSDYYMVNGNAMLFMTDRLIKVDGQLTFGSALTNIWDDVLPNDLHNEGGVSFKKGKKPEKLIKRVFDLTSDEGDLILDFFAGSGTSGAVAHKTNRQYILIEQMDYVTDLTVKRMQNTVDGVKTNGISKDVDWKGGGSFVYVELIEKNRSFLKTIQKAETQKDLQKIFNFMLDEAEIDFRVDLEKVKETLFDLSLVEQKRVLIKILDKNQLYYNYTEIDDVNVRDLISDSDYAFNKNFYDEGGEI